MKIGLLYCAYNTQEYIVDSLSAWINRPDVVISCVSTPFLEYKDMKIKKDKTQDILKQYYENGQIRYLIIEPEFLPEHEARNLALKPLLQNEGIDFLILLDSDEFYSQKEVDGILRFIDNTPFITWFSFHFKNLVFDGKFYVDDFCPPRAFRVNNGEFRLEKMYYDNDFIYVNKHKTNKNYKEMASRDIPRNIAHIKHNTWLNNERSKSKYEYQMKHFGHCGYIWDNDKNCLRFNDEYYLKNNIPKPDLIPLEEKKN